MRVIEDTMSQIRFCSALKKEYGNVVVIQPLPESITKRDILCRVRGGSVLSCILSRFRGKPIAIVKFQDPSSARHYVDFCAEDFTQEIWTFPAGPNFIPYSEVTMTSSVRIYNEAPGLGSTWHTADIPINFYDFPPSATRCLVLRHCAVERVPQIWAGLGLQTSEHFQKQLEDMWLDQPRVDHAAGKVTGTLHIWFSDINTAMLVKQRYYGPLEYEADPCSAMPEDTFILGLPKPGTRLGSQQPTTHESLKGNTEYNIDEDCADHYEQSPELASKDVYIHYHSFPFVSLLDLQKLSIMVKLSQGLLDPMKLLLHSSATSSEEPTQKEEAKNMDLAARLIDALQRHRFGQTVDHRDMRRAAVRPPHNAMVYAPGMTEIFPRGASHSTLQQFAADRSRGDYMALSAPMMSCPPNTYYTGTVGYNGSAPAPSGDGIVPYQHLHGAWYNPASQAHQEDEEPPQASIASYNDPSHPDTPEAQSASPQSDQSPRSRPPIDSHRPRNAECLAQAPYPTETKPWDPPCVAARPVPVGTEPGYTFQSPPPPNGDGYGLAEHYTNNNTTRADDAAEHNDTVGVSGTSLLVQTAEGTVNVSSISQTSPDYSHQKWNGGRRPEDVFWTVSLEEFKAMNDDQWKAFGTSFYIPPAGFNTAKRHVVELE
ncbi:hypothetical protein SLS53_008967 [Cytospora paraplurivora]|uniref:Uncharacterized protein n=1 Tax=Cytospora paraplurivora TaxID=2898453 RepID=A0AAN9TXR3_9PEZI